MFRYSPVVKLSAAMVIMTLLIYGNVYAKGTRGNQAVAQSVASLFVTQAATPAPLPDNPITEFTIPTPKSKPFGIAVDSNGIVWFAEGDGNKMGKITPDGILSEFPLPLENR